MKLFKSVILANVRLNKSTFLLQTSIGVSETELFPGQFYNIKIASGNYPLLRRPFSISDYTNGILTFMINICGQGTELLSFKKSGDVLDLLGPLGNGFSVDGDFENAVIVGGGIGIAPFPYLTRKIGKEKKIITFVGGRCSNDIITYNLENVIQATDDGSFGFNGNVVDCLKDYWQNHSLNNCRIFACGPTPMLKAVRNFANSKNVECQISTESSMACGFGLCQGCAVKVSSKENYSLICKDGPVFNSKDILL